MRVMGLHLPTLMKTRKKNKKTSIPLPNASKVKKKVIFTLMSKITIQHLDAASWARS